MKLISISSYPCISRYNSYNTNGINQKNKYAASFYANSDVSDILVKGDAALNENRLQDALNLYKEALQSSPNDVNINRKLGKVYHQLKDYASAEQNFKIYVNANNQNEEAWIELGEAQRQKASYSEAKKSFETALSLNPANDLARRSILETENNILSCFSPERAYAEKQEYAQKNLQAALNMAVAYMTPEYMKDLANVQIQFGKTASMGGTPNIAQYENNLTRITVSDTYKYAAPQVIAAYLVHESVHAKDNDPYTSVREEQDAYEVATKFWIKNANGVEDPEMDYAASLYKQSPSALKDRVEEIYTLRDPGIAKTSPNHPPEKKFHFIKNTAKAANQPIKEYEAIA